MHAPADSSPLFAIPLSARPSIIEITAKQKCTQNNQTHLRSALR